MKRSFPTLCGALLSLGLLGGGVSCHDPTPPSIIVIVADTLRADRLGFYGYQRRPTSPELDRWSERGRVYEHAYASSPWTVPSFGSLLTGLDPRDHGAGVRTRAGDIQNVGGLAPEAPTLAESLRGRGYATGAFLANPWLSEELGFDRGFDVFVQLARHGRRVPRARLVIDRLLAWLDETPERPVFALLCVFDTHLPYEPPRALRGRFTRDFQEEGSYPVDDGALYLGRKQRLRPGQQAFIDAAYDEEIAALDVQLGQLLAGLEARGFLETGVVVLLADHGEELFEHGGFEHGHHMWESLLRIPLVFWGRDVEPGREPTAVGLVDVAATLRSLGGAGATGPGLALMGPGRRGEPISEHVLVADGNLYGPKRAAVIRWPYKTVRERSAARDLVFDLGEDPDERAPAAIPDEVAADLEAALRDRVRPFDAAPPFAPPALSPQRLQQLRDLGYVEP